MTGRFDLPGVSTVPAALFHGGSNPAYNDTEVPEGTREKISVMGCPLLNSDWLDNTLDAVCDSGVVGDC